MWPWGHVAVAYLCYSGSRRLRGRARPDDWPVVALGAGALGPDLVDKPLAWGLGLFPSGYAVGHSVLVALPLGLGLLVAGHRRGRGDLTAPFVLGYWSHLAGDVGSGLLYGGGLDPSTVLWPVVRRAPYGESLGLFGRTWHYLSEFGAGLGAAGRPSALLLAAALGPALLAVALWLLDGTPGPRAVGRLLRR